MVLAGSGVPGLFPRAGRLWIGPRACGITSGSRFRSVPACRACFRVPDVPGLDFGLADSSPARGSGRFRRAVPVSACRTSPDRTSGPRIHLRLAVPACRACFRVPDVPVSDLGLADSFPARGFGRSWRAVPVSACRTSLYRTSGSRIHLRLVISFGSGVPSLLPRAEHLRIGSQARRSTSGSWIPSVLPCRANSRVPNVSEPDLRLADSSPARGFSRFQRAEPVPACRTCPDENVRLAEPPPARGVGRFCRAEPVSASRTFADRTSGSWIHLRLVESARSRVPEPVPRAGAGSECRRHLTGPPRGHPDSRRRNMTPRACARR
ncbi:hypothetical protein EDF44_3896 [Rathayibacter sp. PhB185]|nr:hypothetical protein EDF45_4071 [Rathayibacter sp. PhB186]ROS46761.1 hypothetical protein EDF44_3896 [Rathayibacter sp. PhB185]